jgi:hypothetical protein
MYVYIKGKNYTWARNDENSNFTGYYYFFFKLRSDIHISVHFVNTVVLDKMYGNMYVRVTAQFSKNK